MFYYAPDFESEGEGCMEVGCFEAGQDELILQWSWIFNWANMISLYRLWEACNELISKKHILYLNDLNSFYYLLVVVTTHGAL